MHKSNDKYYNCHMAINAIPMNGLRSVFDSIYVVASDSSTYNIDNTLIATPYPYQVKLQYDQYY